LLSIAMVVAVSPALGQQPPPRPAGPPGGRVPEYPSRVVDSAMAERGRAYYTAQCAFCHGSDTRGASGPSLLRSQLVQDDRNGETIGLVVRDGRPPMPKFDITDAQLADLAAFLHSFVINSRDPARNRPINIVTGNAAAGQAYFAARCASCHSPDRDLKGIATRFAEPRALQQWWLLPGGGGRGGAAPGTAAPAPVRATVTLPSGQHYRGRLARIDEFTVSLVEDDGTTRSFPRNADTPKVEIDDPLAPHKALLREYTDKDIHDVTAYLVTVK
jgi:mono/diheme cytochrome c family protein